MTRWIFLLALLTLVACDDTPEKSTDDTPSVDTASTDSSPDLEADSEEVDSAAADTEGSDTAGDTACTGEVPNPTGADFFNLRLNDPNSYNLSFDASVAVDASAFVLTPNNGGSATAASLSIDPDPGPASTFNLSANVTAWANGDEYTLTVPASAVVHACGDETMASDFIVEVSALDCTSNSPPGVYNEAETRLDAGTDTFRVTFDERVFGLSASSFTLTSTGGAGAATLDSVTPVGNRREYELTLSGLADGDTYDLTLSGVVDSCGEGVAFSGVTVIRVAPAPQGETCNEAIPLASGQQTYTFSATDVDHLTGELLQNAGCTSSSVLSGPEVVFSYTASATGTLTVQVDAQSDFIGGLFRVAALLHDGTCTSPVVASADHCDSQYAESVSVTVTAPVTAGNTYFLFVAKTDSSPNTFLDSQVTITVTEP